MAIEYDIHAASLHLPTLEKAYVVLEQTVESTTESEAELPCFFKLHGVQIAGVHDDD